MAEPGYEHSTSKVAIYIEVYIFNRRVILHDGPLSTTELLPYLLRGALVTAILRIYYLELY
jgi:hypothetical protein